jgi:hypothetical protein
MVPVVRMKRPILYKPKPRPEPRATIRSPTPEPRVVPRRTMRAPMPKPLTRKTLTRKTMKRPSPVLSNTELRSANQLYDPRNKTPSPKIDASKLFRKMEELQDMLTQLMKKRSRPKLSMNRSAEAYLNAASYEDPLMDLKLKGIKGSSLG